LRLLAYTDYVYRREGGAVFAERAFALFLARLGDEFDELAIAGRIDAGLERAHFRLPAAVRFVELPSYPSMVHPSAPGGMARSLRRFWRALGAVDAVWLLGPHPLALAFAAMAAIRGKRITLGVRQDLPRYVRSRRPSARWVHRAADTLEASFRLLARWLGVVVVGPQLASNYRHAHRLLEIEVSLVRDADIAAGERVSRDYDGELAVVSVGRLEQEKNPLLLADVLAGLRAHDPRWKLVICGEGPLEGDLRRRIAELGLDGAADLREYVPIDAGLHDVYRTNHAFLHVS
jgi:glycosyltransferase involved in cell wall biosynthesis